MIVLDVKIDNYYAFSNFDMNFTYKKKNVNPIIENEYLSYCPTFRYKKFVMVMGSNASGKTTLGKMLLNIFNFINRKEYSNIVDGINNRDENASFSIDFIGDDRKFYHLVTMVEPSGSKVYSSTDIHTSVSYTEITKNDNYEKCLKRIEEQSIVNDDNYIKELEKISHLSWMFKFAATGGEIKINKKGVKDKYLKILEHTLKALDPRIIGVSEIDNDIYVVRFPHRNVVINQENGSDNTLSSGTIEGIGVAHLVASIKSGLYKFFFCDEKFSHVHSDMEKSFISLMIDCLHDDEQLIMTSHNTDILEMNLPKHSFAFLKRNIENEIECVYASDYLKRNTDSIKCAVDNDVFGTSPKVEFVYKLKDIK